MKIAFDVDGCLIDYDDAPRYDVIDLFRWFKNHGWDMYIWSGGGLPYADHWMRRLGLQATVIEKGSIQVDITVDDEVVLLGVVNIVCPISKSPQR